jgi:hypothetical protein
LKHEAIISEYWPEFAQNGKEEITTSDVIRHEAGLHKLHKIVPQEDCTTEGILQNKIGHIIETDTALWPHGYNRVYHAISKDFITNEIFRRVDAKRRTMG